MTAQDATDGEWQAITSYFEKWAQSRGRIVVNRSDQRSFANKLVEVNIEGLSIRLVRDRDTFMLDVSIGTTWHSGRNVLAYDSRLTSAGAMRSTNPDGAVLTLSIGQIKRILRDRRFEEYENAIAELTIHNLQSSVRSGRSRALA